MNDEIILLENCKLQHGSFNNRVYLMKLGTNKKVNEIIDFMEKLAFNNNYSKIFCKIPAQYKQFFIRRNYMEEAFIKNYFNKENAVFISKFMTDERKIEMNYSKMEEVLKNSKAKFGKYKKINLNSDENLIICNKNNAEEMANLYKKIFKTYPFPIYDPEYLKKTMIESFLYFSIKKRGKMVSIASCDIDLENKSVEMTDFATLPEYRSNGYSYCLLDKMEESMSKLNIKTFYTIARASSYAINSIFSRKSYLYAGRLKNNTNIAGKIESMNVWYKNLY